MPVYWENDEEDFNGVCADCLEFDALPGNTRCAVCEDRRNEAAHERMLDALYGESAEPAVEDQRQEQRRLRAVQLARICGSAYR